MTTTQKKKILVTGGDYGLGFQCCPTLVKQPDTHAVLAGRSKERVDAVVAKIKAQGHAISDVESAIIDMGSLASVRAFVESLKGRKFLTIVCKAGVQQQSKEELARLSARANAAWLPRFSREELVRHVSTLECDALLKRDP
jgi:NAD(P)-dependent dehydrogenase (short-subunit alcohol dehydrogenase family)